VASWGFELAGFPEQPLVPDACGEAEHSLADARVQTPSAMWPPWSSRESWPLSGVVDRPDPLRRAVSTADQATCRPIMLSAWRTVAGTSPAASRPLPL